MRSFDYRGSVSFAESLFKLLLFANSFVRCFQQELGAQERLVNLPYRTPRFLTFKFDPWLLCLLLTIIYIILLYAISEDLVLVGSQV